MPLVSRDDLGEPGRAPPDRRGRQVLDHVRDELVARRPRTARRARARRARSSCTSRAARSRTSRATCTRAGATALSIALASKRQRWLRCDCVLRDDYIGRMIRQLAQFVAKISGLARSRTISGAFDEVARAWTELLDVPRELVERARRADAGADARRSGKDACRRRAARRRGEGSAPRTATSSTRCNASKRAFELFLEARAIDPQASDDVAILELARVIPPNEIDPRYKR